MLGGAAAGQALLACSEETSLAHVQSTASHCSHISRAQHCYCDWLGLDGPGPWDRLVKGEGNAGGFVSGEFAGDDTQCPCYFREALAACSPKSTSGKIRVPALTPAMARCLCDGNRAAHTEAGLPLPKATLASLHTSPGEPPPPGPLPGSARRAAAEDVQGHRRKLSHCRGM